jgi:WD40 repeat protein
LASGSNDESHHTWDVATGEITTLYGHDYGVFIASVSVPDGKTLASGSSDKTIKLWDVGADQAKKTLTGHSDSVWSVSFSPDGKTLASGSSDKTIQLWDVDTGKKITIDRDIDGHSGSVNSVSFSQMVKLWLLAVVTAQLFCGILILIIYWCEVAMDASLICRIILI